MYGRLFVRAKHPKAYDKSINGSGRVVIKTCKAEAIWKADIGE